MPISGRRSAAHRVVRHGHAARGRQGLAGRNPPAPAAKTSKFTWAGPADRSQPHAYRIQGPTFLIEFNNTQNNANHVHSVWRNMLGDFGIPAQVEMSCRLDGLFPPRAIATRI